MSARDKDARAAMRELMRAWLAGGIDGPMEPNAVSHDAWAYAAAMATERAKRTEAEAPEPADAPPRLTADQIAEVEKARREGRDAGLDDAEVAVQLLGLEHANVIPQADIARIAREAIRRLRDKAPAPAPDVASLQAENAKLRAVAEAAAALVDGMGGADRLDLRADVKRALTGWRTK